MQNPLNLKSFPVLLTERLYLRQLRRTDQQSIFEIRANEENIKYIGRQKELHISESRAFITMINKGIRNKQWLYWAITDREQKVLIGTICLWNFSIDEQKAEIGYELAPEAQGKGYMQEAVKKVVRFGFEILKLQSIEALTHIDNAASLKLLLSLNFQYKKTMPFTFEKTDEKVKMCLYSLKTNF